MARRHAKTAEARSADAGKEKGERGARARWPSWPARPARWDGPEAGGKENKIRFQF
jgi:hypothetical protein